MPREFRAITRNIKTYLKAPKVIEFVNAAGTAVAKQAEATVGSINGQPKPYLVYREAPFAKSARGAAGAKRTRSDIGPPRFYRTSRTGKKRHRATVTYSHPTPQGRMAMRQALMAAAHAKLRDVVDGEVIAVRKAMKKQARKNRRLNRMSPEKLQARANKQQAKRLRAAYRKSDEYKAKMAAKRRETAAKRKADPEYQARAKARRAENAARRKRSNASKRGWETRRKNRGQ